MPDKVAEDRARLEKLEIKAMRFRLEHGTFAELPYQARPSRWEDRFAAAFAASEVADAVTVERERCARVVEGCDVFKSCPRSFRRDVAAAIRKEQDHENLSWIAPELGKEER